MIVQPELKRLLEMQTIPNFHLLEIRLVAKSAGGKSRTDKRRAFCMAFHCRDVPPSEDGFDTMNTSLSGSGDHHRGSVSYSVPYYFPVMSLLFPVISLAFSTDLPIPRAF